MKISWIIKAGIIINISFLVISLLAFYNSGYLPNPYFYIKQDMFMDFFNINWWATQKNIYIDYKTFYNPFNLMLGKFLSIGCLKASNSIQLRDCGINIYIIYTFCIIIANAFLMYLILGNDENRISWVIFFSTSFPYLYGLERGNYITIAFVFISIYVHFMNKKKIQANLALLMACVFKIYIFVLFIFIHLSNKEKVKLGIIYSILFITPAVLLGYENPELIIKNLIDFQTTGLDIYQKYWTSTTIFSIGVILTKIIGLKTPIVINIVVNIVVNIIFIVILSRLFIYIQNIIKISHGYDVIYVQFVILIGLFLILSGPGFYSLVLLIPLFISLMTRNLLSRIDVILFILCCIPYPIPIYKVFEFIEISYIYGYNISSDYNVSLQMIVPIILFILFFKISKKIPYADNSSKIQ